MNEKKLLILVRGLATLKSDIQQLQIPTRKKEGVVLTRYKFLKLVVLMIVLVPMILLTPHPALSQVGEDALQNCRNGGFSTEEDFVSYALEPPDSNPIISDGDLLSANGRVCARNADLLAVFEPGADLGLDAVDIINVDNYLVAFSTELDDPGKQFTAGDLLVTNGAVIPNIALTHDFDIGYDIGLDALHFVGNLEAIEAFLNEISGLSRDWWLTNPGALADTLREFNIEIWFSTEGTPLTLEQPRFLDGDMLSAFGIIIASNDVLLPLDVPAGIIDRGVDFGLDAFTGLSRDTEMDRLQAYFSTEILYNDWEGGASFSDGDALHLGNGIAFINWDLVGAFEPRARDLGLDAISVGVGDLVCKNQITFIGGAKVSVAKINADGLAKLIPETDHPFGDDVPFWGNICEDVIKFRVVFRQDSEGPGAGKGIPVLPPEGWLVTPCTGGSAVNWYSDADGWFDAPQYRALSQDLGQCNKDLILTNWKSLKATDPDALYQVWLEFDRGSGIEKESSLHPIQLDNTPPQINDLSIPDGPCPTYGSTDMPIMVRADLFDEHFWTYRLFIAGNLYPIHDYPCVYYYDTGPAAAHVGEKGTEPLGTLADLHEVNVFDLVTPPEEPQECCYGVHLWVEDRAILGHFEPVLNQITWGYRAAEIREIFFAYTP